MILFFLILVIYSMDCSGAGTSCHCPEKIGLSSERLNRIDTVLNALYKTRECQVQ